MQQGVAVVESTCNESMHHRLGCVGCERSGDRTQLAQLKVAGPTDGRDMILHRETSVIMRPSFLGGGRILRRTLSVCLSVRPSRYRYRASRRTT